MKIAQLQAPAATGTTTREQHQGRTRSLLSRLIHSPREEQLRYLAQSARLEEGMNPRLVQLTAYAISVSVLAFLLWAGFTNINEIARTPGEVVPIGFEQTVQHLDGGIVEEILVHEGDLVEKGELLVRLNGGGTTEDLARAQQKQNTLELQAERLRAFLEDRVPNFARLGEDDTPLAAEQHNIFDTMVKARSQRADVVRDQIRQKQRALEILQLRKVTIGENLVAMRDLYSRYRSLYDKGQLAYVRLVSTYQELNNLEGEAETVTQQIDQAGVAIQEFESRLRSLGTSQRDDVYRELTAVEAEMAQNAQVIGKLRKKSERLQVRAPERGIIKGIAINTIGGVVQPGQTLMALVPLDDALVVETRINPQHIGHVRVGQPVQIKVSAFDFARYGALTGRLDFVSATTFRGENRDRYYRGRVVFDRHYFGDDPDRNLILPGMTVMAEIITGEKTILEYLLKPVHQAITSAFSER